MKRILFIFCLLIQVASFSQSDSVPNTIETSGNIEFSIDSIYKGDNINRTNSHKVICPLDISTKIKYDLCNKLDPNNKMACIESKYDEHLKDLVEDYQISKMNFVYEIGI